jgi:hypothetical protein
LGNPVEYQVVINGDVLEGWDKEQVIASFATFGGLDLDKARLYFQGKRAVVKKCKELDAAAVWHRKLTDMGINTSVSASVGETGAAAAGATISASRLAEALSEPEDVVPETVDTSRVALRSFVAATSAAVLGALVWNQIALTFDHELGIVALFVGGAVGFASALAGARGVMAGIVCVALVLLASIGGKYLSYQSFQEKMASEWAEQGIWAGEDGRARFDKTLIDAELFLELDGSNTALRYFLFERNYSGATDPAQVTDRELAEFLEIDVPDLRWITAENPSFDQWRLRMKSRIAESPPLDLVIENLGMLDVIFLFLGLITAFRLGSRG